MANIKLRYFRTKYVYARNVSILDKFSLGITEDFKTRIVYKAMARFLHFEHGFHEFYETVHFVYTYEGV